ncbi:hypothetical protein ACP70R_018793 [Stipagrostis hirtigluma subsp. patula]
MFGNHGGMELRPVASSSPETGRVPIPMRTPANSQVVWADMGMVGNGVGIMENANLFDDQLLASAFKNMSLSFKDGATDSAVDTGSFASRDGHYPEGHVISSADSTRNGSLQEAFCQDDFAPSSLMINNAEHMQLKPNVQNAPLCSGMSGPDNVYGSMINRPPASPFQEQLFINGWSQPYAPYQQLDSGLQCHGIDMKRYPLMQSSYAYQQMPHVAGFDVHWFSDSQRGVVNSCTNPATSPHLTIPSVHHLEHGSADIYNNAAIIRNGNKQLNSTRVNNCSCKYCQIQQSEKLKHSYEFRCSPKGLLQNQTMDKVKLKSYPEKILMKTKGVNSIRNIKSGFPLNGCVETNQRTSRNRHNHHLNIHSNDSLHFALQSPHCLSPSGSEYELSLKSAQFKYNSVDEVIGELYLLAKDQNGCRFLQRIFTEGSQDDAQKVFDGVIEHTDELMVDPFGNYLVQKLLEECNSDQKMHILYEITKRPG